MTEKSFFWDGLSIGDATLSAYDTDTLALVDRLRFQPNPQQQSSLGSNCPMTCDGLMATAGGTSVEVDVAAGAAMVNGRYYNNTASVTLTMTTHANSWWAVILRLDHATQTIRLALKGPYISQNAALTSPVQNDDIWEVVTATAYQTAGGPYCYDQRALTVRHNIVHRFIPALGGQNNTHSTRLQHRSDMGWAMPDGDATLVVGQFMIDYDMWSGAYIQPIVIPLGSTITGADVYLDQYYAWCVVGEVWNANFYSAGYGAETIVEQILNLPVSYTFSPQPIVQDGLITTIFYRDATNVLDTYPGIVYCPGWRLTYYSFTR